MDAFIAWLLEQIKPKEVGQHMKKALLAIGLIVIFSVVASWYATSAWWEHTVKQADRDRDYYKGKAESAPTMDLSKLFVVQLVTNVIGGNTIILDYDPIPETVKIRFFQSSAELWVRRFGGQVRGRTLTFTNSDEAQRVIGALTNNRADIVYFRGSKAN